MRLLHVVPYIGEEASGPAYSTTTLNQKMNELGVSSRLLVTCDREAEQARLDGAITEFPRRSFPYRLGRSPEMLSCLRNEVATGAVDVIHNHSIWMMPNVYPGWVTTGTDIPLVVSPHGTFSKWALGRSKAVKFLFWNTLQKRALVNAALFHATAASEYDDIRRLGFRQPVAMVPNGIDIPRLSGKTCGDNSEATLLFLSRVHPVKGLEYLLHAWATLQDAHPRWVLRIVGPGEPSYLKKLSKLASSLRLERVAFTGPLYGHEKDEAYRCADLFVLPTHSENFGVAVAESLAAGCPVVTTRGAPWSGLVDYGAGWWIDIGVEPLRAALDEAMSRDTGTLAEMGARGRAWMERDFSWDRITAQMIESYRWIREGGTKPEWIVND